MQRWTVAQPFVRRYSTNSKLAAASKGQLLGQLAESHIDQHAAPISIKNHTPQGAFEPPSYSAPASAPEYRSSVTPLRRSWSAKKKAQPLSFEESLELRKRHLSPSQKLHYAGTPAGPLKLITGRGQYMYDDTGKEHLDCVNNVCHVGHCHPRVVRAASEQLSILNTNSRYLHDNIVVLAKRVAASMPDPLEIVFFVNSGSEANDLALRLARNHTRQDDVYCVDGAYHGNTQGCLSISPYGKYANMRKVKNKLMAPDTYRLGLSDEEVTKRCVAEFKTKVGLKTAPPAAFIIESLQCCAGQVILPQGYLPQMYQVARSVGALTIADEVQTGFGRIGTHFWAFQHDEVVPDIVTIGKPFGNGFPLAAVVTTRAIAESSDMLEYFNTFGGNPVACAVGLEVLDVIEEEGLQQRALEVGSLALQLCRQVQTIYPELIGDVRGRGLLIGIEFVQDAETRTPYPAAAKFVMQRMKSLGVLTSTDGPFNSVIKIKPPMCFDQNDATRLAEALDTALHEYTTLGLKGEQ
jgi:ethanolamine-phosphate phospho-lyase